MEGGGVGMVVQPNSGTWNQWHFEVFEFNKANIQTANQGSSGQQAIKRIKERYLPMEVVFASDGACLIRFWAACSDSP
jgi:hypothetical protein